MRNAALSRFKDDVWLSSSDGAVVRLNSARNPFQKIERVEQAPGKVGANSLGLLNMKGAEPSGELQSGIRLFGQVKPSRRFATVFATNTYCQGESARLTQST